MKRDSDTSVTRGQILSPKVQFVEIDDDRAGQRIDNFLLGQLKGVPKNLIYRILRKGEVRVNKGRIKAEYKLKAGDMVRIPPVRLPDTKELPNASDQLKDLLADSILFENKGLIILNKPSGLAVHGGSGINLGLIEVLRQMRPDERHLELVHRLDRDTSGCIMIAKKRSMLRYLHQQLRDGHIQKYYHALVEGRWPNRCREVSAPLKKNELSSGERIVRVDPEGKQSLTHFKVLRRYVGSTLVEAKPITGRTHQIRVHAQYQGHGLVGDPKYGNDDFNKVMKGKGFNRLFLHAAALSLLLPDETKKIRVEAPLDERLAKPLAQLEPADPGGEAES
ncbi:23S rRNA pseudouridine(955/2504/2580) synthase RluC [Aestuariicella sp. G3-2]|uniref:23S rRNA pseudouridine(955/2504/2580) synthase RluC n=1 Tax=Pseudomaricurvus albidus TaxID=2842452 RepID=UPI001C0BFB6C|nr:23S rRNA pseudouridine(955/2504/2580) synthase RluC [Aestuariicella albida]MBU3070485.1 23S rRNA pseudouridine(955/2504/2580) synthase RluC [Aestuariicella albida]